MPMPDVGLAPPPPVDVAAQMKPSSGPLAGGAPDLASILAGLAGGQVPALGPDLSPQIMEVQPLLTQLARQVPALGPDVDQLNAELKSRMSGLPALIAGNAGPMNAPAGPSPLGAGPAPMASPAGGPGSPVSGSPFGGAAPAAPLPQPGMPPPPPPVPDMGAMGLAMQLETKLPAMGRDDPTLMPAINGFIARMREEVPKVVNGETEAINPPTQVAPTEAMLSKIPVQY